MFILFVLLSGLVPLCAGDGLRLIVLGDWGADTKDQKNVAEAMGEWAAKYGVDYIVSTGDNFYDEGVNSTRDSRFQTTWKDVYSHPAIADKTWLICAGNHDHKHGHVLYQVQYSKNDPKWHFPDLTYSYEADTGTTTVDLVAIDTDSLVSGKNDAEKQLRFLHKELEDSKADWKIVFGHIPPYSVGFYDGSEPIRDIVVPLLDEFDVDFYLSGHDHNMEHIEDKNGEGPDYFVCGSGGQFLHSLKQDKVDELKDWKKSLSFFDKQHGFTFIEIHTHTATVTMVSDKGKELYRYVRTKKPTKSIN